MSTFDTRMANQRTTNFPSDAPNEREVKTASVRRKHKAVLAILTTALGTMGLLTIPAAAPAHADCDQFAFNGGDYKVISQNGSVTTWFRPVPPPAPTSTVLWSGDGWLKGIWSPPVFPPLNLKGNLDKAFVVKDNAGVTRIEFDIDWSNNPFHFPWVPKDVSHFEGTVASDGSASGSIPYPWHSVTPLGCLTAPGQGEAPAQGGTEPCDAQPPQQNAGLSEWVNYARMRPEKFPPLDNNTEGAQMSGCCHKPLTNSDTLLNLADTHNRYIATQSDYWLNDDLNAHRTIDGTLTTGPTLQEPADGPIFKAGYHSARGEIVAWGQTTAKEAVQSWMQHDAHAQWGHRNNIVSCGQVKDGNKTERLPDFQEAGAAHYQRLPADPPGPWEDYWTVDFGTH